MAKCNLLKYLTTVRRKLPKSINSIYCLDFLFVKRKKKLNKYKNMEIKNSAFKSYR